MNLLIMGPPGAGKGTQASGIADHNDIPAISTGQLFRDNITRGTALGRMIESRIAAGDLVPDELTNEMVFERLAQPDVCRKQGFLLDGYPRTVEQASAFDAYLRGALMKLDGVIALRANPDSLVQRLLNRAKIEGRADDNEASIQHRIDVYAEETAPLLTLYGERGLLVNVDADGSVQEVAERLKVALAQKLGHREV